MANSINTMCIVHIFYLYTYVCTYNHPLTSKGKSAMCHSQAYEDTLLDRDSAPVYIGDYVGNVAHGQGWPPSKMAKRGFCQKAEHFRQTFAQNPRAGFGTAKVIICNV